MKYIEMKEFDTIYEIMKEAFPPIERRTYEDQKALLMRDNYHLHTLEDKGNIMAFISVWDYDGFIFIEHLAIAKDYRNRGLGADLLKNIISFYQKMVILEVELPQTDIATRRIGFYQRLGFVTNEQYSYEQPPLQEGFSTYPLWLMSYPANLTNDVFESIKKQLYLDVYGIKEAS